MLSFLNFLLPNHVFPRDYPRLSKSRFFLHILPSILCSPMHRGILLWLLQVPSGWQTVVVSSLEESR